MALPGVDAEASHVATKNLLLGVGDQKAALAFISFIADRSIRKDHPKAVFEADRSDLEQHLRGVVELLDRLVDEFDVANCRPLLDRDILIAQEAPRSGRHSLPIHSSDPPAPRTKVVSEAPKTRLSSFTLSRERMMGLSFSLMYLSMETWISNSSV